MKKSAKDAAAVETTTDNYFEDNVPVIQVHADSGAADKPRKQKSLKLKPTKRSAAKPKVAKSVAAKKPAPKKTAKKPAAAKAKKGGTLREAVASELKRAKGPMTVHELALAINERKQYKRPNGKPVSAGHIAFLAIRATDEFRYGAGGKATGVALKR